MPATTTRFTSAGNTFQAELFTPAGAANGGAVIIAHGSDGPVNNNHGPWLTMMQGYANGLADQGVVALIPYYFGVGQEVDFSQLPRYHETLADAMAYAKTLPGVDGSRIGLLGFSLGGYLCLRNRALTHALVEFFAPVFLGIGTSGNHRLHAQIHHGDADLLVPLLDNAKPIESQLIKEKAGVALFEYADAGHGFNGDYPGDAQAQQESKTRTLDFFQKHL